MASAAWLPSWPQFGVPCGLLLSTLAVIAFSSWSGSEFLIWGWRIPFALSIILVGIGLWIRLGILETPVFQKLLDTDKIEKAPILEVIKKQPKEIILSALLRMSEQAPFYIFTAFVFAYAVGTLKMDRNFILSAVVVAACVSFFTIPISGHISDLIGRRKMYLIGVVTMGLFGFLYFAMMDPAMPALVFLAIVISLIPHDMQYGPQAALIAESFTPRLRYSGASLGYQLASIIAGGPAPLIATALFATYHSGYAIAIYIAVCAVISLISAAMMPDYTGKGYLGRIRRSCSSGRINLIIGNRQQRRGGNVPALFIRDPEKFRALSRSADRSGACGPCRHRAASARPDRWRCPGSTRPQISWPSTVK